MATSDSQTGLGLFVKMFFLQASASQRFAPSPTSLEPYPRPSCFLIAPGVATSDSQTGLGLFVKTLYASFSFTALCPFANFSPTLSSASMFVGSPWSCNIGLANLLGYVCEDAFFANFSFTALFPFANFSQTLSSASMFVGSPRSCNIGFANLLGFACQDVLCKLSLVYSER